MKKVILIFGVLLSISFLFVGCGSAVNDSNFVDEVVTKEYVGVLNELDYKVGVKGTHTLKISPENILHLRSTSIDLSSDDYLGNIVKVEGVMDTVDSVLNVTSISVVKVVEKNDKVTLDDYENSDFGIKMKYYSNMDVIKDGSILSFIDVDSKSEFRITQIPYAYEGDLIATDNEGNDFVVNSPLRAFFLQNYPEVRDFDSHLITVGLNGLQAVQMPSNLIDFKSAYFLYRNGLVYEIDFYFGENIINEADMLVKFKTMLSAFDFIVPDVVDSGLSDDLKNDEYLNSDHASDGSSEALSKLPEVIEPLKDTVDQVDDKFVLPKIDTNLSVFESSPYSFSGEYPSSWYYSGSRGVGETLHHYGFSDKPLDESDEILSVDVVSVMPSGATFSYDGRDYVESTDDSEYIVSTKVGSNVVSVHGPLSRKDLILNMASSLLDVDDEVL